MRRKPLALVAVLAFSSAVLTGCGFQPLYGNGRTVAALSQIDVDVPQGRPAYLIRQQLLDELARDRGAPASYRVVLTVGQSRGPLGARVNNIANRYELNLSAHWTLVDEGSGKPLSAGDTAAQVSYDSPDPPYAGVVAEQDAEVRAAGQIALQLRIALARYFVRANGG